MAMSISQAKNAAAALESLAEPTRLRIVELLAKSPGGVSVTGIATDLDLTVVNASHHLGVLRTSGIAVADKDGRFVRYSLNPDRWTPAKGTNLGTVDGGSVQVVLVRVGG